MTDRKIRWRAIENNPEVLTDLIHKFGLDKNLAFHDVYSLTDPDLLAFVPRPALALVLVFPHSAAFERAKAEEDGRRAESTGLDEPDVVWLKQTIGNACGTMAILHTVANNESRVAPDSEFATLLAELKRQDTAGRVHTIEHSRLIDDAHQSVCTSGQSAVIAAEESVELHFVAFVRGERNGHLYELDGGRNGPVDHGALGPDEDVLGERGLAVVNAFIAKARGDGDDLNFSLCALGPA